jgi:AraC-like DNA-binding protein
MDKLDSLLMQSNPNARVFYAGQLSEATQIDASPGVGHIHVLYAGHLRLTRLDEAELNITQPSLILFPRATACSLIPTAIGIESAKVVCAHVDFGQAMSATLALSIPDVLVIPLEESTQLGPMLRLMFEESSGQNCGKKVALNHLMNYFLVLLLRKLMVEDSVKTGILAAMADTRLAVAVTAMHDEPQADWTLENLAEKAGMSRARFASHFRAKTGTTPLEYLTIWRIEVAKNHLRKGQTLKAIAPKVGYSSAEALIRSFLRHTQITPKEWLRLQGL